MQFSLLITCGVLAAGALSVSITVSSTGGNLTSKYQYGIMFEDINRSGDGGLYAELISNRAFQGTAGSPSSIVPWQGINAQLALQNAPVPVSSALPTSLHVTSGPSNQIVGVSNNGYWGIDVKPQTYKGSFWIMGAYTGNFTASLQNAAGSRTWATASIQSKSKAGSWSEYDFLLTPTVAAPDSKNVFQLSWTSSASGGNNMNIGFVSLFPPTYKNRANGMRVDLMEDLKALNPSFIRAPGGNNIEGSKTAWRWQWNQTIGRLIDRPGRPGTWGYYNTDGLGLVEYLDWCEDLEMEPVLALWSGFSLDGAVTPQAALQPYIQDALNELEFIMGDNSTTYGRLRISLGYPTPWKINIVEVGNEDNLGGGYNSYNAYRFQAYYTAIIAKYPHMTILASMTGGTQPGISGGDYHNYNRPDDYVSQFNLYDHFSPQHKTLIGEYACIQNNTNKVVGVDWSAPKLDYPNWIGTVGEAVFLIGAERNTDKILGASYAPLLSRAEDHQWTPNLITFNSDPSQTSLSTSYMSLQLLGNVRTTTVLPAHSSSAFGPAYWVAGFNNITSQYILKAAVYNSHGAVPMSVTFPAGRSGILTVLSAPDQHSQNALASKNIVATSKTILTADMRGAFNFQMAPLTIAVLTVDV